MHCRSSELVIVRFIRIIRIIFLNLLNHDTRIIIIVIIRTERIKTYTTLLFLARRVIAHFVPNFVAMATAAGRGKMQLPAFDGPSPKTGKKCKNLAKISYASRVIAHFVPIFLNSKNNQQKNQTCINNLS